MKKKVLSLALALALCLGLTVPAAAADPYVLTMEDISITNTIFCGDYSDHNDYGAIPVLCRAPVTITALEELDSFYLQTEKAFLEEEETYLDVVDGNKIIIEESGCYVLSTYVNHESDEFGNGGGYGAEIFIIVEGGREPSEPTFVSACGFKDVPESSPYVYGIKWALENGITKGKTADTFGSYDYCSVSQLLTFLWRADGKPSPTGTDQESAVAWALQKGIISKDQDLYAACNRAMVFYSIWKLKGSPEPEFTNDFEDVPQNASYANAIDWAAAASITNGIGDFSGFEPEVLCTRGQIVSFLLNASDL